MRREVQNVARHPVFIDAKCLKSGRGERIRTSGPCLPKTATLAAHGSLPLFRMAKVAHMLTHVLLSFRPKVHHCTLEHCLTTPVPATEMM